jgi:HK97 family phage major capsid protein
MKASRQVLSDIPQLRSIIDQRLLYGLAYKEESQLLNGDGTGQNLNGIIPQATAFTAPITLADLNIMDVLRLAMLQAALAEYPATGHVMHPSDWATSRP